jgi:hypothetical protein
MAEYTPTQIVALVRTVVEAAPFALRASETPYSFDLQPQTVIDGSYRLVPSAIRSVGALGLYETRTDTVELWTAATHDGDVTGTLDTLTTRAHSLTAAIVRDGIARDYMLVDEGRAVEIRAPQGATYAVARLTLPLTYAATL